MADTNPNEERPLEAWLEAFGPFGVLEALPILEALATTLVELHAAKTVHARLGPEHVRVLERDGTCVLSLPEPWGERENPHLGFSREADLRTLGQLATRLLTGSAPQRNGGPKGTIRPLWLVEPRLPFELSALIHALVREDSRDLPSTASVKERLSLLLAELEGSLSEQEPASAPLGAAAQPADLPPRRTTTTTFATADVIAKLLEKPLEQPAPPSPVPWGVPAMPPESPVDRSARAPRPRHGRLDTRHELPSTGGGDSDTEPIDPVRAGSELATEPPEASAVGSTHAEKERVAAATVAGATGGRSSTPGRVPSSPSNDTAQMPASGAVTASDDGVQSSSSVTRSRSEGEEEDAAATHPGQQRAAAEDDATPTSPDPLPPLKEDEAAATSPSHPPAPLDDEEVVATSPHPPAPLDDEEVAATSPSHPPAPSDVEEVVATSPSHPPALSDDDEVVATSPGHPPAPSDADAVAAPSREESSLPPGDAAFSASAAPTSNDLGKPRRTASRKDARSAAEEAAATLPVDRPVPSEATPTAPGIVGGTRGAEAGSSAPGAGATGPSEAMAAPSPERAPRKRRTPAGMSARPQLAGEQATAWGPDPRQSPRRTPRPESPTSTERARTPANPRRGEPDEPTRAAPRMATPPRPVRTGPARLVVGGAAAEARPSRAKLIIGGGDIEARPRRAKLIIGGGDAAGPDGAPLTMRSETQDLQLEPWAMPTVQVTMPEDILGPLPGPLRRLGAGASAPMRAVPGEVALPRPSILLRAAAVFRPASAKREEEEEELLEPTRPLEPLPSPDAPWLSETVQPEERLKPAEVLRLIPIWVWVLLGVFLLGLVLIFSSTEPTESRVLPEERRMIPGLEDPGASAP